MRGSVGSCLIFLSFVCCCLGGSLLDVEHIVIFMQENRAFDHYYGTMKGVRGFNDKTTVSLPNGSPVWYQDVNSTYYELPWHMDTLVTSGTCAEAAAMDYPVDIAMWNKGLFDSWNSARSPETGMSYFKRTDLPFYYSLVDSFTICDQYFQSVFTQTNPNRLHLFTGSNGLSVGQTPVLDNDEPNPGFTWKTFAEVLEAAGVSWKVYQETDNFDDNAFEWFELFQKASPGSPWYEKGVRTVPDLVSAFQMDIESGALPQVSWIVAPMNQSEHARNRPAVGEDLTARLLKALGANPKVFSKTAFFLNYDEQGGFFDHIPPPTPPVSPQNGISTVTTAGEVYQKNPIGLGFRVPMIIVSPWTQGGYVCSEVFDHTSVIQFVEKRFGVRCENISPWRRAVSGDLTRAFNFSAFDPTWPVLPDTSGYVKEAERECDTLPPPTVPIRQGLPVQEPGTRPSRPLPYEFCIDGVYDLPKQSFRLNLMNTGLSTVSVIVYDSLNRKNVPWHYTVEPLKNVTDYLGVVNGVYGFEVHGPNGFMRTFTGKMDVNPDVSMRYLFIQDSKVHSSFTTLNLDQPQVKTGVSFKFNNTTPQKIQFKITPSSYKSDGPWFVSVDSLAYAEWNAQFIPGGEIGTGTGDGNVFGSGNWYHFTVTIPSTPFKRQFLGRVENGQDSISDPAMAR